jgi:hypothetical protein
VTRHDSRQVTPFGHPGITARLTAPPGLSQPPTSFIGPWYQGIHRPPLPTYPHTHTLTTNHRTPKNARVHYANLNPPPTHNQPPTTTADSTAMPGTKTTTPTTTGGSADPHRGRPRLFPQNPNRVSTARTDPPPAAFPTPPPGAARTSDAGTTDTNWPASPPSSTPARHPRTAGFLDQGQQPPAGCSLERR